MPIDSTSLIGHTIHSLIIERGHTQQTFADALGISEQVMGKIVTGKKVMNVAELTRIAQILGISKDLLLAHLMSSSANESHSVFENDSMREETKGKLGHMHTVFSEIRLLEDLLDN
jgi:transcriptional regulator with XRE-family HTH domain